MLLNYLIYITFSGQDMDENYSDIYMMASLTSVLPLCPCVQKSLSLTNFSSQNPAVSHIINLLFCSQSIKAFMFGKDIYK